MKLRSPTRRSPLLYGPGLQAGSDAGVVGELGTPAIAEGLVSAPEDLPHASPGLKSGLG